MREITVASQIHLEKSYVKVLMKVLKGVAHRRCARDTARNHYHAWRHQTERKRSRAVLQRVFRLLLKVTVRHLHTVFDNWAWEAGHTRALDRKCHVLSLGSAWVEQTATITSSVRRPLHGASAGRAVPRLRRLRAALGAWKAGAWTQHDAWRHRLLRRFLAHKVISAWSNKALEHSRIRHKVTLRLVSKLHTCGQELARAALVGWAHDHARRRRKNVAVVRSLLRGARGVMMQSFEQLRQAVHDRHASRRVVVHVVRMLMKASMVRCMARWLEWVGDQAVKRRNLRGAGKILRHMLALQEKHCFHLWQQVASESKAQMQLDLAVNKFVQAFLLSAKRDCWFRWMEWRQDQAAERRRLRDAGKILRHMLALQEKLCFSIWQQLTRQKQAHQLAGNKIVQKALANTKRDYWSRWMEWLQDQAAERSNLKKAGKILRHMLALQEKLCFSIWQRVTSESKAKLRRGLVANRIVQRLALHAQKHCFQMWAYEAHERRITLVKLQRVWLKSFHRCMDHGFQALAGAVKVRRQLQRSSRMIFGHTCKVRLSTAFDAFRRAAADNKAFRRKSGKLQHFVKKSLMRNVLRRIANETLEQNRLERVSMSLIQHKSLRLLATAFHGVRIVTWHHRERSTGVRALLLRVTLSRRAFFFTAWVDSTKQRRILAYKAKKILTWQYKRLMHTILPSEHGLDVDTVSLDHSRLKETIANTWCLIRAFGHLRLLVRQNRRTAGLAARLFRGILGRSFNLWCLAAHQYHRLQHQYAIVIVTMKPRFLRRVFKLWSACLVAIRRLGGIELQLSRVTRRSCSRGALLTWMNFVSEGLMLKSFLKKWTGNRKHKSLQKSWCIWADWGRYKAWLRSVFTTSAGNRQHKTLQKSWCIWADWGRYKARLRSVFTTSADDRRREILSETLGRWADWGRYKTWLGSLMNTCFVYRKARMQRNCLREWGRFSCCSKWLAVTANKVQLHTNLRRIAVFVVVWSEYALQSAVPGGCGGMFVTHFKERCRKQKILHAWVEVCRGTQHSSWLFEVRRNKLQLASVKRNAFEAWLECTQEDLRLKKQQEQDDWQQTLRKQEEEERRLEVAQQEQALQQQRVLQERQRDERLLMIARHVGRRSHRAMLQHSLVAFCEVVESQLVRKRKAFSVLQTVFYHCLVYSFRAWRDSTHETFMSAANARTAHAFVCRLRLRKSFSKLLQRTLRLRHLHHASVRLVLRWTQQRSAQSCQRWRVFVDERRRLQRAGKVVLKRWSRIRIAAAFENFKHALSNALEEFQLRQMARPVALRTRRYCLGSSMSEWAWIAWRRRVLRKRFGVASSALLRGRFLRRHLHAWTELASSLHGLRSCDKTLRLETRTGTISFALEALWCNAKRKAKLRDAEAHVAKRHRRLLVFCGWRGLQAAASFRSRLDVLVRRVANVIAGSDWALLQWALGGMRERTVRYRRLFVAARRLMNWHSHLLQRNAFNSLSGRAHQRRWETTVSCVLVNRRFARQQRCVLRAWCTASEGCVAGRRHARVLWLLYCMRALGRALATWFGLVYTKKTHGFIRDKIARRHRALLVSGVFCELHYGVQETKLRRNLL